MALSSCVSTSVDSENSWILDRFGDVRVLRYEVPGFEELKLDEKLYIYYLAQAAEAGQDIIIDQNFKYNITLRDTFKALMSSYEGDRDSDEWRGVELYAKQMWFANGIHHHYSGEKFTPQFSADYLADALRSIASKIDVEAVGASSLEGYIEFITPIIFDNDRYSRRITREEGVDLITASACNYYDGVTQAEAESFYADLAQRTDDKISLGLNSKLIKDESGAIVEQVYKIGGLYSTQLEEIVYWLERAREVATPEQSEIIRLLVEYYRTGDLKTFDDHSIAWVKDQHSKVDFVNGFIEVYGDPLGRKAAWEGLVNFRDEKACSRTELIANNAQWFEDRSPINPQYRKAEVKGISAKVITVAMLGGDCYPSTPIGINLPNAEWIRRDYGSKSVTIDNVTHAYAEAGRGSGFAEEFYYGKKNLELIDKYGEVSDAIHVDMHECLGHGSGQVREGVSTTDLGSYYSVIEEVRADLFGLYFIADEKMLELGLLPSMDAAKAQYIKYLTNGSLTQLARIKLGDDIEQTHMRNRQLISSWVLERGDGICEIITKGGKEYVEVYSVERLRKLFGDLLHEIQRIKSEGDFEAAKMLVERYGVKIDRQRHEAILERYAALNIEPYSGFANPSYTLVKEGESIVDVKINYPTGINF
ncbi:MAG: dihydrofolate reductase [Rikenellaceae bacterium]